ncbi:MAG: hypothetical protein N3A38_00325 [Planctomycetota bacterium]|nr:hypothetical protein [Planctomycetota bacterium]
MGAEGGGLIAPGAAELACLWTLAAGALAAAFSPVFRKRIGQAAAVGLVAFREALRDGTFPAVIVMCAIPGLAAALSDADGTPQGRLRLVLDWTLNGGALFCALATCALAAIFAARDADGAPAPALMAKPVPRYVLPIGRAAGIAAMNACWLLWIGILAFILSWWGLRREAQSGGDADSLYAEVFSPASLALPREAGAGADTGVKLLRPGGKVTFSFPRLPISGRQWLDLRVRLYPGAGLHKRLACEVIVRNPETGARMSEVVRTAAGRTCRIRVGRELVSEREGTTVEFASLASRDAPDDRYLDGEWYKGHIALPPTEAARFAVPAEGPLPAMVKILGLFFLKDTALALAVSCWSGAVSFPVAGALGLFLLLAGETSGFARAILLPPVQPGETIAPEEVFHRRAIEAMFLPLPDFGALGGMEKALAAEHMPWSVLARAFTAWVLLFAGPWAAAGWLVFRRKEIGA